jgi:oxygen-independent coproporphyrinogen-3 oxidase
VPTWPDIVLERGAPAVPMPDVQTLTRPGVLMLRALPPLALYVHFPWCVRKCPYCDFNSHEPGSHDAGGTSAIPEREYLDALCRDLEAALPLVWGRRVISIFIGGGTPSLLSAAGLDRLLSDVRARLPVEADCEITLEANPGTVEARRFVSYRASGVNRLSLGIQSFDETMLKRLGRVHDGADAIAAAATALAHFDNVNLDLMVGLPGQSSSQAQADVKAAIDFGTPHLSLYQLTLEPNTVFAKYPPELPDDDTLAAVQDDLAAQTAAAGFEHYEVSAFARPGRRCRHNLNYWQFGDYLGIGAGAHSKLSFPHRIVRQSRLRQPASYLQAAARGTFLAESFEVPRADVPFEFMLNALRLTEGFPTPLFSERTGMPLSQVEVIVDAAIKRGLLDRSADFIRPTLFGRRFLNDLQAMFLHERRADSPT